MFERYVERKKLDLGIDSEEPKMISKIMFFFNQWKWQETLHHRLTHCFQNVWGLAWEFVQLQPRSGHFHALSPCGMGPEFAHQRRTWNSHSRCVWSSVLGHWSRMWLPSAEPQGFLSQHNLKITVTEKLYYMYTVMYHKHNYQNKLGKKQKDKSRK